MIYSLFKPQTQKLKKIKKNAKSLVMEAQSVTE